MRCLHYSLHGTWIYFGLERDAYRLARVRLSGHKTTEDEGGGFLSGDLTEFGAEVGGCKHFDSQVGIDLADHLNEVVHQKMCFLHRGSYPCQSIQHPSCKASYFLSTCNIQYLSPRGTGHWQGYRYAMCTPYSVGLYASITTTNLQDAYVS